jgi:hypothetical protein
VIEIGQYRPPSGNNKAENKDFGNHLKMTVFGNIGIVRPSASGQVRSVLNEKY